MTDDPDDVKEALSPLESILNTAKDLENAKTGALVATTGGCLVIGFVVGGIFWMPFAMTVSLLVYRLARHYSERDQRKAIHHIQLVNVIKDKQREIWESNLPEEQKKYLSGKLNQLLEGVFHVVFDDALKQSILWGRLLTCPTGLGGVFHVVFDDALKQSIL